ncbi:hypothetical protein [Roseateles amylovorans]|uniref:FagA protein n=1 Tax=Roseateles amylovorans TaxID=2978473 RepID=A0ABY6B2G5_9BURK|nr:hypothetical protein [Roseateles amylovorans]UXH79271.1 hypothetical protein N4261_04870 [Roseateles amylovorans]
MSLLPPPSDDLPKPVATSAGRPPGDAPCTPCSPCDVAKPSDVAAPAPSCLWAPRAASAAWPVRSSALGLLPGLSGGPALGLLADDRARHTADHPGVECLRWMAFKIACGLTPEDPQLLRRHQLATEQLVEAGVLAAIPAHEQALRLLYSTAHHTLLPWHWRCACMDQLNRPLAALSRLAGADAALAARLQRFQWCLSQSPLKESR